MTAPLRRKTTPVMGKMCFHIPEVHLSALKTRANKRHITTAAYLRRIIQAVVDKTKDNDEEQIAAMEKRLITTLQRIVGEQKRLHETQQTEMVFLSNFLRLVMRMRCLPGPQEPLTSAEVKQLNERYENFFRKAFGKDAEAVATNGGS
jgi:hypothetical protein